jgi:hypothetical protein
MRISEKLSDIKQKEGQLMRLYSLRDSVIQKEFQDAILNSDKRDVAEVEKREKEFIDSKKVRVAELTKDIDELKAQLIEIKNKINQKNVELGLDKKLIQMKYIRLELSKLMNLTKKDVWSRSSTIDVDIYETLGISDRIKELEAKKAKLDTEIQKINWTTEFA